MSDQACYLRSMKHHTYKTYTAHEINEFEKTKGPLWEKESFDRYVRSDRDLEEKFHYICRNPWDSGVAQPNEPYPWLWTSDVDIASGSARGPRVPVGGPPTGTMAEEGFEGADPNSLEPAPTSRRAAAPNTPAACAPQTLAAGRRDEHAGGVCFPEIEVLLDLDIGQHRTGVEPGSKAVELYRLIESLRGLKPGGLHAYDGHIHDTDVTTRMKNCEGAFAPVAALRQQLEKAGCCVARIVSGGTPTFAMHARRPDVECSPGTCVFWDAGYGTNLPDLDFVPAALILTRIVSKPTANRLCLDLGHKAIASEMPHPRVQFLNLAGAKAVAHNEEHLVVETERAGEFVVGDCLYGIPWHICPTVALHSEAVVVEDGTATQRWKIVARERRLTI